MKVLPSLQIHSFFFDLIGVETTNYIYIITIKYQWHSTFLNTNWTYACVCSLPVGVFDRHGWKVQRGVQRLMDNKSTCVVCWVATLDCQPEIDKVNTIIWIKYRLSSVCMFLTCMENLCVWEDHPKAENLEGNWSGFHKQGNFPQSEEIQGDQKRGHNAYFLCEFGIIKVSHSYSCPTGVQAEAEQGSGTVRLHGNTAGVQ